jgi:hypothetical protein
MHTPLNVLLFTLSLLHVRNHRDATGIFLDKQALFTGYHGRIPPVLAADDFGRCFDRCAFCQ